MTEQSVSAFFNPNHHFNPPSPHALPSVCVQPPPYSPSKAVSPPPPYDLHNLPPGCGGGSSNLSSEWGEKRRATIGDIATHSVLAGNPALSGVSPACVTHHYHFYPGSIALQDTLETRSPAPSYTGAAPTPAAVPPPPGYPDDCRRAGSGLFLISPTVERPLTRTYSGASRGPLSPRVGSAVNGGAAGGNSEGDPSPSHPPGAVVVETRHM